MDESFLSPWKSLFDYQKCWNSDEEAFIQMSSSDPESARKSNSGTVICSFSTWDMNYGFSGLQNVISFAKKFSIRHSRSDSKSLRKFDFGTQFSSSSICKVHILGWGWKSFHYMFKGSFLISTKTRLNIFECYRNDQIDKFIIEKITRVQS